MREYFDIKTNQKNVNIPSYILFFMACYVIWQMSIIWLDANSSIINSMNNIGENYMSNLGIFCVVISTISILFFTFKPKYSYLSCKIFSIISLITTFYILTNNHVEQCLFILVGSCSILSISSLAIYIYTYNSNNLKRQNFIEMIGVGIVSVILHGNIIKINFITYNIISIILLLLFIIGINKITDVDMDIRKKILRKRIYYFTLESLC